jgi:hypothetical protein
MLGYGIAHVMKSSAAPETEIEITPEMIAAGTSSLPMMGRIRAPWVSCEA